MLRLKFKLIGTEGFVNSGVQIRSQGLAQPPNEMIGYHADIGDGWWGGLYDDWNYLTAAGRGVFGGVALAIDNPVRDWWGEFAGPTRC